MLRTLTIALPLLGGLACGGIAVIDPEGQSASGGAASSSNASTSTSSSTTTSMLGGCMSSADCAATDFCDLPEGLCGGPGACAPRPQACDADCPGVCGCDGQQYCNACEANSTGVDVAGAGECVSYGARYIAGEVDDLVLYRRDLIAPSCTALRFWSGSPAPGYEVSIPPPWSLYAANASPHADDCPSGADTVAASTAKGGVALMFSGPGLSIPCALVFEAELTFDDPPDGLPSSITFDTGETPVENGCF